MALRGVPTQLPGQLGARGEGRRDQEASKRAQDRIDDSRAEQARGHDHHTSGLYPHGRQVQPPVEEVAHHVCC